MAYQSLYRKYRPTSFEDVVGQKHIVITLKNALLRNQIAHAYLFTGPRGTGKTTVAKLLARGVNCLSPEKAPCGVCENCQKLLSENHPDIIEIDAASNNGVNDVREIIEKVKYAPLQAKYKVYIIDEVHMLSTGAFNALLKTLEEPPAHVIFILATTEIHKVLPTIISRTQRYDFSRVSVKDLIQRLSEVLEREEIEAEPAVIEEIAHLADGGFRDGLTILEQVIAYSQHPLTLQDIYDVYKISTPKQKATYIEAIVASDLPKALDILKKVQTQSIDYKRFILDIINLCKETLISAITGTKEYVSSYNQQAVSQLLSIVDTDKMNEIIESFLTIQNEAKFNGLYQNYLEIATIKLCQTTVKQPSNSIATEAVVNTKSVMQPKEKPLSAPSPVISTTVEQPRETKIVNFSQPPSVLEIEKQMIAMMVLGDKQERVIDQTNLINESLLNEMKFRRIARLIPQVKVGVSSRDYLLFYAHETIASALNISENKALFLEYVYYNHNHKNALVVSDVSFKEATELFLSYRESNQLPSVQQAGERLSLLTRFEPEKVQSTEELLNEIFGGFRSVDA